MLPEEDSPSTFAHPARHDGAKDDSMIDLHVHTSMSDGTFSPQEVVRQAAAKGLRAIAITDHDTVNGVSLAQEEGRSNGVEVLSGVEISSQWHTGILHILGYFVNPLDGKLLSALEHLRQGRVERVPKIVSKLRDQDVFIRVEEVHEEAGGGVPGRPHVANVMLRQGAVRSLQEAFDLYLKKGASAYVEKVKLPPDEAIAVIVEAGGVAVIAHPYSLKVTDPISLEQTVRSLMEKGIRGIEAFYPRHTQEQTQMFLDVASRLGLVATGGTDFHGANKPTIKLGVIPGRGSLPYSILEDLTHVRSSQSAPRSGSRCTG